MRGENKCLASTVYKSRRKESYPKRKEKRKRNPEYKFFSGERLGSRSEKGKRHGLPPGGGSQDTHQKLEGRHGEGRQRGIKVTDVVGERSQREEKHRRGQKKKAGRKKSLNSIQNSVVQAAAGPRTHLPKPAVAFANSIKHVGPTKDRFYVEGSFPHCFRFHSIRTCRVQCRALRLEKAGGIVTLARRCLASVPHCLPKNTPEWGALLRQSISVKKNSVKRPPKLLDVMPPLVLRERYPVGNNLNRNGLLWLETGEPR